MDGSVLPTPTHARTTLPGPDSWSRFSRPPYMADKGPHHTHTRFKKSPQFPASLQTGPNPTTPAVCELSLPSSSSSLHSHCHPQTFFLHCTTFILSLPAYKDSRSNPIIHNSLSRNPQWVKAKIFLLPSRATFTSNSPQRLSSHANESVI